MTSLQLLKNIQKTTYKKDWKASLVCKTAGLQKKKKKKVKCTVQLLRIFFLKATSEDIWHPNTSTFIIIHYKCYIFLFQPAAPKLLSHFLFIQVSHSSPHHILASKYLELQDQVRLQKKLGLCWVCSVCLQRGQHENLIDQKYFCSLGLLMQRKRAQLQNMSYMHMILLRDHRWFYWCRVLR